MFLPCVNVYRNVLSEGALDSIVIHRFREVCLVDSGGGVEFVQNFKIGGFLVKANDSLPIDHSFNKFPNLYFFVDGCLATISLSILFRF
jgi:hypothetical protein